MNALDDIRIRTGAADVTEDEAAAVVTWCREWVADAFPDDADAAGADLATLLRGCDRHIDGGLAFVLADVRATRSLADRLELAGRVDDAAELRGTDEISRETRPAVDVRAAFPTGAATSAAILERRLADAAADPAAYEYEITFTPSGDFGRRAPRNADGTVTVLRGSADDANELAARVNGRVRGPLTRARHIGRGD